MGMAARIFRSFPPALKHELQRIRYRYLIRKGQFRSDEREYDLVEKLIGSGDVVVDIGANVGYYTLQFSRLVGQKGMVISFEPITRTFDLLSSNVFCANCENVTLINTVISKEAGTVGFTVPKGNYFQAHISEEGELRRMAIPLNLFDQPQWGPDFMKIDAEGMDMAIITSSVEYMNRHRPVIMVELGLEDLMHARSLLDQYTAYSLRESHNGFLVPMEQESNFLSRLELTELERRP